MAFRLLHGHREQPRHWVSLWPLAATWTTGVNTDPGCVRTTDPDMALRSCSDRSVPMAPGGTQATHICPFLTTFFSSTLSLSTAREPLCSSFPPISLHICSSKRHPPALSACGRLPADQGLEDPGWSMGVNTRLSGVDSL